MKRRKILAFIIEENSKIKHNAEDGSCKFLGLFSSESEADKAYQKQYEEINTYDGFKGHYIKYFYLPEENQIANIEVANWLYMGQ